MVLANSAVLLEKAQKRKFAVPAFNSMNLETAQAIVAAAEAKKAPVILQVSHKTIEYAGLENTANFVLPLIKAARVPIALQLDHGKDFETVKRCISLGFSSVMIDGSKLPLDGNIALTKKVVSLAQKNGVSVEAEVGALGENNFTEPKDAKEFCSKVKVDSLAVAVGTSHGAHKFAGKPKINLALLKQISSLVDLPLVLHGASSVEQGAIKQAKQFGLQLEKTSGVPMQQLKKAIKRGVCKINIDTDLRLSFSIALREYLQKNSSDFDARNALSFARSKLQKTCEKKIIDFGASNKAK